MAPVYGAAEIAIDRLRRTTWRLVALIEFTMLSGRASLPGSMPVHGFKTIPMTSLGQLIPEAYLGERPWWVNPFENIAAVEFNHRLLAIFAVIAVLAFESLGTPLQTVARLADGNRLARGHGADPELGLGIATLMLFVPVWHGALHQAGGLMLLTLAKITARRLTRQIA